MKRENLDKERGSYIKRKWPEDTKWEDDYMTGVMHLQIKNAKDC